MPSVGESKSLEPVSVDHSRNLSILLALVSLTGVYSLFLSGPNVLGLGRGALALEAAVLAIPFAGIWLLLPLDEILDRRRHIVGFLVLMLLGLGCLNVIHSANPPKSMRVMTIFLLAGPITIWTSSAIFREDRLIERFHWFCCLSLLVLVSVEITLYAASWFQDPKSIRFFLGNPIPTGTAIILLLVGPLSLLGKEKGFRKVLTIALILAGLSLIVLTQRRGTLLAIFAMVLFWAVIARSKWALLCSVAGVGAALVALPRIAGLWGALDPKKWAHFTVLFRIESFLLGLNIFPTSPWLGIGVRTYGYTDYLADYQLHNPGMVKFGAEMSRVQTLDNMFMTFLVEFGSLFAVVYACLIFYILYRYIRCERPFTSPNKGKLIVLLPLVGVAVQSVTYDTLLSPPVNWLFSVQMGILAATCLQERKG